MLTGTLISWLRYSVAAAFVLSAGWKLRHRSEFAAVVALVVRPAPAALRGALTWLVQLVELAIAGLLVAPSWLGRAGAVAAAAFTVVVSASLFRNDLRAGCGCWSSGEGLSRGPLLARNAVLVGLSATSLVGEPAAGLAVLLFGVPIGTVFALVILELPTVVEQLRKAAEVGLE